MSELAFDKEGNPFRFSRRTKKLRPRRWKNPGQRGTCAAVLDADGEQIFIDTDAEFIEFRAAVDNVPGFYRLDQCDEDGTPIEDAPPAYVSLGSTRNAAPTGDIDPRDAIIRDLAQINADMCRTMAERFSNVMQATADVLRAADGAGLSRREPPPLAPAPAPPTDADDEDEDEEESEPAPPNPFGAFQPLVEMAMPHLPAVGAFLWAKLTKQNATSPAAGAAPSGPTSPPAPAPAAPSPPPVPGDVTAGPSAPEPVAAPAPTSAASASSGAPIPAPPAPAPTSTASASSGVPIPTPAAPASAATAPGAPAPVPPIPAPAAADVGATPSTATASAAPARAMPTGSPRNAPPAVEPTPEQWAHLFAVRSQLSPREVAIVDSVIVRMTPETRVQWLADLSVLSLDQAADFVRSLIREAAITSPKPPTAVPPPASPAASSSPPTVTARENPTRDGAAPSTSAIVSAAPASIVWTDDPPNAPPTVEPTPEQWAHLFAIRSRLTPRGSSHRRGHRRPHGAREARAVACRAVGAQPRRSRRGRALPAPEDPTEAPTGEERCHGRRQGLIDAVAQARSASGSRRPAGPGPGPGQ